MSFDTYLILDELCLQVRRSTPTIVRFSKFATVSIDKRNRFPGVAVDEFCATYEVRKGINYLNVPGTA